MITSNWRRFSVENKCTFAVSLNGNCNADAIICGKIITCARACSIAAINSPYYLRVYVRRRCQYLWIARITRQTRILRSLFASIYYSHYLQRRLDILHYRFRLCFSRLSSPHLSSFSPFNFYVYKKLISHERIRAFVAHRRCLHAGQSRVW